MAHRQRRCERHGLLQEYDHGAHSLRTDGLGGTRRPCRFLTFCNAPHGWHNSEHHARLVVLLGCSRGDGRGADPGRRAGQMGSLAARACLQHRRAIQLQSRDRRGVRQDRLRRGELRRAARTAQIRSLSGGGLFPLQPFRARVPHLQLSIRARRLDERGVCERSVGAGLSTVLASNTV